MSANVESMFYNSRNGIPWWKGGTPVDGLATAKEALEAAKMDWRVEKQPIFCEIGGRKIQVPGKYTTVRMDREQPLGVVGEVYTVVQNVEAFDFLDSLVDTGEAKYETAGALGNGENVWLLAKVPGNIEAVRGDPIERYLALHNSHDGSHNMSVFFTGIRVVCENTLNQAIRACSNIFKIRHTKNYQSKLEEARECLGFAVKYYDLFAEEMRAFAQKEVSVEETKNYVNKVIPLPETKQDGRIETVKEKQNVLFSLIAGGDGADLPGVRGTAYGLYQAAVEYADHYVKLRKGDTEVQRAESVLLNGTLSKFKQHAYQVARDLVTA